MNEAEIIREYEEGLSTGELAEKYNTYNNKILRILNRNNVRIRTKSESQKLALEKGRAKHPTEGRTMDSETRIRQSESHAKRWRNLSEEERESFKDGARERWEAIPKYKREEILSKAGEALNKAAKNGSKAERYLCEKLVERGYKVVQHKKNLIPGKYELDIYLPEINTVIEVDGPQHFLPIFGEDTLKKHIQFDNEKNGLLIKNGITVIRVKYLIRHLSNKVMRDLWKVVEGALKKVEKGTKTKLIEVEINE